MATRGKRRRRKQRVTFARLEAYKRGESRRLLLTLQRVNGSSETITYRKSRNSPKWYVMHERQVQAFDCHTTHVVGLRHYLRNKLGGGCRGAGAGPNHYVMRYETPIWQTTRTEKTRFWISESELRAELAKYGKSLD